MSEVRILMNKQGVLLIKKLKNGKISKIVKVRMKFERKERYIISSRI